MANDYAALQARVADELNKTTFNTQIQAEILSSIRHYERERFWFTEYNEPSATIAAQAYIAAPTDLIEIDTIRITYQTRYFDLVRRDWSWYRAMAADDPGYTSAVPTSFVFYANRVWFAPVPDQNYVLQIDGVRQLAALSAGTDSNSWTTEGEELIRARTVASMRIRYMRDPIAIQEAASYAGGRRPYLTSLEKAAYKALKRTSALRMASGPLRTEFGGSHTSLRGMF